MNFFASQDRARASTRRLIVLYTLAVLGVVISLNVVAVVVMHLAQQKAQSRSQERRGVVREPMPPVAWEDVVFDPRVYAVTTFCVLAVIGIATLIKQMQVGGDGSKIAELLGGKPIIPGTADLDERKLLNVVEEMSLASGVPVPRVYVLEGERAINAFASGTRPEAAVIGVTRGAIRTLGRDELQGVVAHEFSHILNGDMRLNLRLIALNFGIMAIGYIGLQVLRHAPRVGSGKKDGAAAVMFLFAVGVAVMIIGYVGVFFGKLLQAAVSRQREYLADASAVQFTRNPGGISNALKKIGGYSAGAELESVHAGEASHMFFAGGVAGFLDSMFATHPPLPDRIRAIDPSFDGKMITQLAPEPAGIEKINGLGAAGFATITPPSLPRAHQVIAAKPADLRAAREVIDTRELSFAALTLDALPSELLDAAHDPYEARALALALLLDGNEGLRGSQLRMLAAVDEAMATLAAKLHERVEVVGPAARLPLLDLALPALHQMSRSQRTVFRQLCNALAEADGQLSPFELALAKVLEDQLPIVPRAPRPGHRFHSMSAIRGQAALVLSALANAGGEAQADAAFAIGAAKLGVHALPARSAIYNSAALGEALDALRDATPAIQRRMVDAASYCVAADRVVRIEEIELMRALCAAFSVPIPPFLVPA